MDRMLPAFEAAQAPARLPFGARSPAAVYLGQLLSDNAPDLQIVAIARRPGVLSKVAVRPTQRLPLTLGAHLVVGPGLGAVRVGVFEQLRQRLVDAA